MKKYIYGLTVMSLALALCGCGKKDDKLELVTEVSTETVAGSETETEQSEDTTEAIEEYKGAREEASEEDKAVTLDMIREANKGDALVKDNKGYSINKIYYYEKSELGSEYQYIGFDDAGNYIQAYEDSAGFVQVLDNYAGYWYVDAGEYYGTNEEVTQKNFVLIYPEDGMEAQLVDYTHNNFIINSTDDFDENITDVYREDGNLVVETSLKDEENDLTGKYYLTDSLEITEYTYYYENGDKYCYAWTVDDADYTAPEYMQELMKATELRNIEVIYADGDGLGYFYEVPKNSPIDIRLTEYKAYLDEACTIEWQESDADAEGGYGDETIYLKK